MRYWGAWYAARCGQAPGLPVPVPVVIPFIVDHAARGEQVGDRDAARNRDQGDMNFQHS
jgi:hypothetical protein